MIEYRYLRCEKAKHMKKREVSSFPKKEVAYSVHNDAVILPLRHSEYMFGSGGVTDSSGEYIESSGIELRFWGNYAVENTEYRDEEVVYCGLYVKHWGHFLIETVARLWYFLKHDNGSSKYIFVVEENGNKEIKGNYYRFFELLGISDRIEVINKPTKFRKVIVPELSYSRTNYYSEEYRGIFDTVAKNALIINPSIEETPKIYFSRAHFNKAVGSEIGTEFIDSYFKTNGFTVLYPEELSLEEMICYIRNADVCATPSGTLPHNFLFAQDGKKVIILERQTVINEIQIDVDRVRDLNTVYVDGHWSIYPSFAGGGPFYYGYTAEFRKFTIENNYLHPEEKFLSEKYKVKNLRTFLKIHRKFYGYDWGLESWAAIYAEALVEAHDDTVKEFYDYLKGIKPFLFKHYFKPGYIKRMVKKWIFKFIRK